MPFFLINYLFIHFRDFTFNVWFSVKYEPNHYNVICLTNCNFQSVKLVSIHINICLYFHNFRPITIHFVHKPFEITKRINPRAAINMIKEAAYYCIKGVLHPRPIL